MLHHRLSDLEGRSNELTRHLEQVKRGLSTVQQSGGDMKEALVRRSGAGGHERVEREG